MSDVCHTEEECVEMYLNIPVGRRENAVAFLASNLSPDIKEEIRIKMQEDPENWIAPYHFIWGMQMRNYLREHSYGEEYLQVHNLDDVYVFLIEDAVAV